MSTSRKCTCRCPCTYTDEEWKEIARRNTRDTIVCFCVTIGALTVLLLGLGFIIQ